jgi:hypothetical protein
MNIFRRIHWLILIMFLAYSSLNAQNLKLVRTDVDSTRFSFVTATYLFGFDIYIDAIDSCTGVSFDLNYTYANYIHFSEARTTEFGYGGKQPVIITRTNTSENSGYVYCGVLTGDTVGSRGFDNPKVIHLEFAVSQNAPHGYSTIFSFSNIQAVISTGTSGRIIQLTSDPITFNIHGFIDVWPGDANNDGTVDTKDVTTIGRFMGYGSSSKTSMRSFKRANASTLWSAQPVLAWDSIDVAHSDCDGNGDVTVTDILIVALNFGKNHTLTSSILPIVNSAFEDNYSVKELGNYKKIPIYISSNTPIIGSVCRLNFENLPSGTKIIAVEKGNLFSKKSEFFTNYNSDEPLFADVSDISTEINQEEINKGVLCYVDYEGDELNYNNVRIESLYGAVKNSYIIPLNSSMVVDENNKELLNIDYKANKIELYNSSEYLNVIKIYNYTGNEIINTEIEPKQIYTVDLPLGVYIVNSIANNKVKNYKIISK